MFICSYPDLRLTMSSRCSVVRLLLNRVPRGGILSYDEALKFSVVNNPENTEEEIKEELDNFYENEPFVINNSGDISINVGKSTELRRFVQNNCDQGTIRIAKQYCP